MKGKILKPVLLSSCFFLISLFADLNGKWKGMLNTPDGNEISVVYNFKVDGEKLTGTAESPEGVVSIDSGKVSGNTFSFDVTVDGNVYPHSGKIYDDSCGLDVDFGSTKMHTTLVRDTLK